VKEMHFNDFIDDFVIAIVLIYQWFVLKCFIF